MAPEDVESSVTFPLEKMINGIAGVRHHASVSRTGQATIWIELDRGTDVYEARQLVAERIQSAAVPPAVDVSMAAPSSGETLLIALRAEAVAETAEARNELAAELRGLAEFSLRRRLLAIPGLSQVSVTGGMRKQYQVVVSAERLEALAVTLPELAEAIAPASARADGLSSAKDMEVAIRSVAKLRSLEDVAGTVVRVRDGRPVLVKDVADVRIGWAADRTHDDTAAEQPRAPAAEPAVILAVQLQPDADKQVVSRRIDEVLQQFQEDLPSRVNVERKMDPRLDRLVSQALQEQRRGLPPDVQLIRRSSDRLGDLVVRSSRNRIKVKVFGPDLAVLRPKADEIRRCMAKLAGVVDLQVEPQADAPKLGFEIDRERASRLGFTVAKLSEVINMAIGEQVVSQIHSGNRTYDLVIKSGQPDADPMLASNLRVRTQSGELVPLSQLAKFQATSGPRAIYRENMRRLVLISCAVEDRERSDVESDIQKALAPIEQSLSSLEGYCIEYANR